MRFQKISITRELIVLLLVLLHGTTQAASLPDNISPFLLTQDKSLHSISAASYWLEDPTNSLTAQDIIDNQLIQEFKANNTPDINLGYRDGTVWFYVPVQAKTLSAKNWHIRISSLMLSPIEMFVYYQNGKIERQLLNRNKSNKRAHIYLPNGNGRFSLAPNETSHILLKVKTEKPVQFSMELLTTDKLINITTWEIVYYSILLGVFGIMFFYGVFALSISKNLNHLFYLFFIVSLSAMVVSITGHGNAYLWPNSSYLASHSIPLSTALCCILGVRFTRHFFKAQKNIIHYDKLLLTCTALAILLLLATFFIDQKLAYKGSTAIFTLTSVAILIVTVAGLKHSYNSIRFYCLAWGCLLLGWIITMLLGTQLVPINFFTLNSFVISAALAVIFLPLALEDYINHRLRRNITLKEKTRQQLEESNNDLSMALAKLAKSNRVKDQFLATISHELRTPMNGVEGSLGLLDSRSLPPQQQGYINSAKLAASEMTSLIDSILKFSEIQSGQIELNPACFEIRPSLNIAAQGFQQQCRQKNISFNLHIDKDVPMFLCGDLDKIALIINQLIDNAIKFTYFGQIIIDISVLNNAPGDMVLQIIVIDTGTGIPPQKLQHIFDAFHQLDSSHNRRYKGLGIGLAICNQMATIMGGKLVAQSKVGFGTTITASLPVSLTGVESHAHEVNDQAPFQEADITNEPETQYQKTILIAEDNPVNRMVLEGMLRSLGCFVLTANDGQAVLDLLENQPIDLILMDCQMPNIDGFEATEKIRLSQQPYSDIPIIAVTANAMDSDNARCLAAGMNDYIKKPINKDIVLEKVRHWLNIDVITAA